MTTRELSNYHGFGIFWYTHVNKTLLDPQTNSNKIPNWLLQSWFWKSTHALQEGTQCLLSKSKSSVLLVESQLLQSISFNNLADYISDILKMQPLVFSSSINLIYTGSNPVETTTRRQFFQFGNHLESTIFLTWWRYSSSSWARDETWNQHMWIGGANFNSKVSLFCGPPQFLHWGLTSHDLCPQNSFVRKWGFPILPHTGNILLHQLG